MSAKDLALCKWCLGCVLTLRGPVITAGKIKENFSSSMLHMHDNHPLRVNTPDVFIDAITVSNKKLVPIILVYRS